MLHFLSAAATIAGLFSFAGLGLQMGTLKNLRERVGDLTGERDDLKSKRAEDKATIAHLNSTAEVLRGTVTGEVHLTAISDVLGHHHQLSEEHWRTYQEDHQKVTALLDEILRIARGRDDND